MAGGPIATAGICIHGVEGPLAALFAFLAESGLGGAGDRAGPDASDAADVAAALGGDGDAYARLVERHKRYVAGILRGFTRDWQAVEELTQDVFVAAYDGLAGFRGDASLRRWLRTIAVRAGYRYWRKNKAKPRQVSLEDIPEVISGGGTVDAGRAAEVLHALLVRLAPRDRLVLTLLHVKGMSVAEAAEASGWSRVMVRVQAHRARKRLKRILTDETGGSWTSWIC